MCERCEYAVVVIVLEARSTILDLADPQNRIVIDMSSELDGGVSRRE